MGIRPVCEVDQEGIKTQCCLIQPACLSPSLTYNFKNIGTMVSALDGLGPIPLIRYTIICYRCKINKNKFHRKRLTTDVLSKHLRKMENCNCISL